MTSHKSREVSVQSCLTFWIGLALAVFCTILSYLTIVPTEALAAVGKTFITMERLNVRAGAGTTNSVLTVAPQYTAGIIQNGPIVAGGYTWYDVQFFYGQRGWVAGEFAYVLDDFLASVAAPTTPVVTPTPTPSVVTIPPPVTTPANPIRRIAVDFDHIFDWEVEIYLQVGMDPDSPITHQDVIDEIFEGDSVAYETEVRRIQAAEGIYTEAAFERAFDELLAEILGMNVATVSSLTDYDIDCYEFTCPWISGDDD